MQLKGWVWKVIFTVKESVCCFLTKNFWPKSFISFRFLKQVGITMWLLECDFFTGWSWCWCLWGKLQCLWDGRQIWGRWWPGWGGEAFEALSKSRGEWNSVSPWVSVLVSVEAGLLSSNASCCLHQVSGTQDLEANPWRPNRGVKRRVVGCMTCYCNDLISAESALSKQAYSVRRPLSRP